MSTFECLTFESLDIKGRQLKTADCSRRKISELGSDFNFSSLDEI